MEGVSLIKSINDIVVITEVHQRDIETLSSIE